ncbi:hypothetical protein DFH07DRAFT_784290 [Mycena maculata]|uniref:Uncharacterized protein n=1 Tax=Mycena maculata TaxID=230809 RepID=A0AAD7HH94_9AGAR|nr:hypothetical protein DFH07DRAFT_784290 [Mycena maculata]
MACVRVASVSPLPSPHRRPHARACPYARPSLRALTLNGSPPRKLPLALALNLNLSCTPTPPVCSAPPSVPFLSLDLACAPMVASPPSPPRRHAHSASAPARFCTAWSSSQGPSASSYADSARMDIDSAMDVDSPSSTSSSPSIYFSPVSAFSTCSSPFTSAPLDSPADAAPSLLSSSSSSSSSSAFASSSLLSAPSFSPSSPSPPPVPSSASVLTAAGPAESSAPSAPAPALEPYTSPRPSYSPITPHLSISDLAFAEDASLLRKAGVTHVVSVVGGRVHIPPHIPAAHRLHVPLADAPFAELVGALGPVVAWVGGVLRGAGVYGRSELGESEEDEHGSGKDGEGGHNHVRILIHCAHGISRSPAVGAALLVALPLVEVEASESLASSAAEADVFSSAAAAGGREDAEEDSDADAPWTTPMRCASPSSLAQAPAPAPTSTSSPPVSSSSFPPASSSPFPSLSTRSSSSPAPSSSTPATLAAASAPARTPARRTLSAPAALAYVAARRPAADVNWGFRAQLAEWEGVCRAGTAL